MKIYLAAKYSWNPIMRDRRGQLEAIGHTVTSRWIDQHGGDQSESAGPESLNNHPENFIRFALNDLYDVMSADMLIFFSAGNGGAGKGGRHTELGIAIGMRKDILFVGPRENVFHTLPQCVHFCGWEECLAWIKENL